MNMLLLKGSGMIYYFYNPNYINGWLANFSQHPIKVKNKSWKTVEHYYQGMKFKHKFYQQKIYSAKSPTLAKRYAKRYKRHRYKNWSCIKQDIMFKAICFKFHQYKDLKFKLKNTKQNNIIEETKDDMYWGIGFNKCGSNHMGKLLIKCRKGIIK